MLRLLCLAVVLVSSDVCFAQRLVVKNTMKEGVHFWIKSDSKPVDQWTHKFIPKNGEYAVRLESPDRFQVVVEDPQHRKFSAGFLPLKEMLEGNPQAILKLDGEFQTMAAASLEWSPSLRGWVLRQRTQRERTAVIFNFHVNEDLSYEPIPAYRVE